MANEEHLAKLKRGATTWNKWRGENPDTVPDLRKAMLIDVELQWANLQNANLSEADLTWAGLRGANLTNANLCGATFTKANLKEASLCYADLTEAVLTQTDLSEANLAEARLSEANCTETIFSRAVLTNANLTRTILTRAILTQADFQGATFTGACLYGTARDDWTIDRVRCDYIYWDHPRQERTPKNRIFRPGEFEELHKSLPSFNYYFEAGFTPIDPIIMARVVDTINEQNPEFNLDLINFDKRGQPHATFTVLHKEAIEAAKQEVARSYEERFAALEGKQEQMMQLMAMMVNNPQKIELIMGNKQITAGNDYIENIEGDNFDSSGGNMNIAKDHGSANQSNDTGESD